MPFFFSDRATSSLKGKHLCFFLLAATPHCITQTSSNYFELAGRISASLGLASKFQFTSISKKMAGDLSSFIDSKQIHKYLGKIKSTCTRKQIKDS